MENRMRCFIMKPKAVSLLLLTIIAIGFLLFQSEWLHNRKKSRTNSKVLAQTASETASSSSKASIHSNKETLQDDIYVDKLFKKAFKIPEDSTAEMTKDATKNRPSDDRRSRLDGSKTAADDTDNTDDTDDTDSYHSDSYEENMESSDKNSKDQALNDGKFRFEYTVDSDEPISEEPEETEEVIKPGRLNIRVKSKPLTRNSNHNINRNSDSNNINSNRGSNDNRNSNNINNINNIINRNSNNNINNNIHSNSNSPKANSPKADNPAPLTTTTTKVIMLTYMRGGSTFFGELLNQNRDALYWFEPFGGMYDSYYGDIWHPEDYFFTPDQKIRKLPEREERLILDTMDKLLNCDPDHLPVGCLSNPFLKFSKMKSLAQYASCVLAEDQVFSRTTGIQYGQLKAAFSNEDAAKRLRGAPIQMKCNKLIQKSCDKTVSVSPSSAYACADNIKTSGDISTHSILLRMSNSDLNDFALREKCVQQSKLGYLRCSEFLKAACAQTSIRALKAIRLRMETVVKYMRTNPDVKVIWLVRDPRAILNSRLKVNLMTKISREQPAVEGDLLCHKIEADISAYETLPQEYQKRILITRYEDLVSQAEDTVRLVYSFLGLPLTNDITNWLDHAIDATDDDKGLFGTQRRNGTATANKWRSAFNPQQHAWLTHQCQNVLSRFMYP